MPTPAREREVSRIRARLLRLGFPRLRMLLLILLTGGAGLFASFLMLRAGLLSMPLRYALALLAAYAVFLLLVREFVRHCDIDLPDFPSGGTSHAGDGHALASADAGGDAGGWSDALGADESVLPLLLVIAVAVVAFASLWVVASAPTLFAELAIDGALSAGLYRRLRRLETHYWLHTAVRRTIWPFAATALTLVAFALAAQHYRPEAHSIGEVLAHHATISR